MATLINDYTSLNISVTILRNISSESDLPKTKTKHNIKNRRCLLRIKFIINKMQIIKFKMKNTEHLDN